MRILVSGSNGLLGKALCTSLFQDGQAIVRLLRTRGEGVFWDPAQGKLDIASLGEIDAVIHLSGDPIATGRWSVSKKQCIMDSRIDSTRFLSQTLATLPHPPKTFVCASALGFYGDRGVEWIDESSACGTGFLAEVCSAWETATEPARAAGIRVVHARFSMVLTKGGGGLATMLPAFRLGLGGPLGSGEQFVSWITLTDAVRAIRFVLDHPNIEGPVNFCTPNPVTQKTFAKTLGACLHRPAILPTPAFVLRILFGELADALLLASTRAKPTKLLNEGFTFSDPTLQDALQNELEKCVQQA